jgi:hypothetical protein
VIVVVLAMSLLAFVAPALGGPRKHEVAGLPGTLQGSLPSRERGGGQRRPASRPGPSP